MFLKTSSYNNLSQKRILNSIFLPFLNLNKKWRRILLLFIDVVIVYLSIRTSFWIVLFDITNKYTWILSSSIFLSVFIFTFTNQYTGISRYYRIQDVILFSLRNLLLISCLYFLSLIFRLDFPNIRISILLLILSTIFLTFSRIIISGLINYTKSLNRKKINVLIYGAGEAGAQLSASLNINGNYKVVAFIDDDNNLLGRSINGVKIINLDGIGKLQKGVDQILLAIPSLSVAERKQIIKKIQNYGKKVLQIPSIEEIKNGRAKIDTLRPISIESLLSRKSIKPINSLFGPGIKGKSVCIIGAGGSIGKELARQITFLKPKKLILVDISEANLYEINQELLELNLEYIELISLLGNAIDKNFVKEIFLKYKTDIVFHAAAYKHVPMVEDNPIEGIKNNVFSTLSICLAAEEVLVKKIIFISTDKAVRPTNVMGASKRLAELIIQNFANENKTNNSNLIFSMVRFGNVLGSSGSVVPKFREQIEKGGPITLTHPDVVRYFMTIPEAVQLVIQASEMALGGEVFLLDMGKPVKIANLAEQMIKLSGLSVKSSNNRNGDIEIINIGLRPGEKLYEELTISPESQKTKHELIFKTYESSFNSKELNDKLDDLKLCINQRNIKKVFSILSLLVPEWKKS